MFVTVVAVHDGTNSISSTVALFEPLWARSTHVVTFRMVTIEQVDHWLSPLVIKLHLESVNRKYRVAINNTAGGYRRVTWAEQVRGTLRKHVSDSDGRTMSHLMSLSGVNRT